MNLVTAEGEEDQQYNTLRKKTELRMPLRFPEMQLSP